MLIVARDVTRQILSERAGESLRATEARLNIALEAADLGAWSARDELGEFMSSPHAAVLHGLSPDTVFDHDTAMSVIHPDDREAVRTALERAIATKGVVSVEYRAVPPGTSGTGGAERWMASRGRWIDDPFTSGGQLFGIVRDITGRKHADAERESLITRMASDQARFEALVESLPAGVLVAEAPEGRIVYGNRRIEEILRHPVLQSASVEAYGEWVGWHPDGNPVAADQWPLARALKGEFVPGDEFLYRRGDGTTGWIRVCGAPVIDAAGTITGSVVVLYDVDREKQAVVALRNSEERVRSVLGEKETLLAQKDMLLKEVNHRVKNSSSWSPACSTSRAARSRTRRAGRPSRMPCRASAPSPRSMSSSIRTTTSARWSSAPTCARSAPSTAARAVLLSRPRRPRFRPTSRSR